MKFHKLVKSIDYVTYPALVELRKINNALGDSLSNLFNVFVSTAIGVIMEITPLSDLLIERFVKTSNCTKISEFGNNPDASGIIAIFCATFLFCILGIIHFIKSRWGSNKDTVDERREIAFEFYKVIIPKLISIKSIVEQHDDSEEDKELDKRFLLLLQAKYELIELLHMLSRLKIIELKGSTNVLTRNSKDVLDQIGADAYYTVLIDIIHCVQDVYSRVKQCAGKNVDGTLSSLRTSFLTAQVFTVCKQYDLKDTLCQTVISDFEKVKDQISDKKKSGVKKA